MIEGGCGRLFFFFLSVSHAQTAVANMVSRFCHQDSNIIVVHYIAYRIKISLDEAPQFVDNFLVLASFEVSILNGT